MKKITLIALSLLLSLTSSSLMASEAGREDRLEAKDYRLQEEATSSHSSVMTSAVTATQYSDFLNQFAAGSDPNHLYNEAMGSDPTTASIVRVGEPGRWHYEVIAGRENCPICYVSHLAQANYADRLQFSSSSPSSTSTFNFNSQIEDVTCNNDTFEVEVPSTMLTLVSSSFPTSTSTSNFDSYITDVSSAAALLGLLAAPELMMRFGDHPVPPEREIPLEEFETAAATHPLESRLILHPDSSSIMPQEEASTLINNNAKENKTIIETLRSALQQKYPRDIVGKVLKETLPNQGIRNTPAITTEELQSILAQAKEATLTASSDVENRLDLLARRKPYDQDEIYAQANEAWKQAQEAWDLRSSSRQETVIKEKILQELCSLLKEEEERLAGTPRAIESFLEKTGDH